MSNWCPENDGAYRAEMAAMAECGDNNRSLELEVEVERLHNEVASLRNEAEENKIEWYAAVRDMRRECDRAEAAKAAYEQEHKACRDLTEKVIPNLREKMEAAEAKLRAVAELPGKWRALAADRTNPAYPKTDWYDGLAYALRNCADELAAILAKGENR